MFDYRNTKICGLCIAALKFIAIAVLPFITIDYIVTQNIRLSDISSLASQSNNMFLNVMSLLTLILVIADVFVWAFFFFRGGRKCFIIWALVSLAGAICAVLVYAGIAFQSDALKLTNQNPLGFAGSGLWAYAVLEILNAVCADRVLSLWKHGMTGGAGTEYEPGRPDRREPMYSEHHEAMRPERRELMYPERHEPIYPDRHDPMRPERHEPIYPDRHDPMRPDCHEPSHHDRFELGRPSEDDLEMTSDWEHVRPERHDPVYPDRHEPEHPDWYEPEYPDRHESEYPDWHEPGYPERHEPGYTDRHESEYPERHEPEYTDRHESEYPERHEPEYSDWRDKNEGIRITRMERNPGGRPMRREDDYFRSSGSADWGDRGHGRSKTGLIVLILAVVTIIIAAIWFFAFRKTNEQTLLGRWSVEDSLFIYSKVSDVEFYQDGTMVTYHKGEADNRGTWHVQANRLSMDIVSGLTSHSNESCTYSIEGNTMTWEMDDGEIIELSKN